MTRPFPLKCLNMCFVRTFPVLMALEQPRHMDGDPDASWEVKRKPVCIHPPYHGKSPENNPHLDHGKVNDGGFLVPLSKPRERGMDTNMAPGCLHWSLTTKVKQGFPLGNTMILYETGTWHRSHSNDGHFGFSSIFTLLNNPVMNIFVLKSLPTFSFLCSGKTP